MANKNDDTVKNLADSVKALQETAKGLTEKMADLKKPEYTAEKNPQNLFHATTGEVCKDSRPYSFLNIIKACKEKDWSHAKLERQIHQDLVKAGYQNDGGTLIPTDPDSIERFSPSLKGIKALVNLSDNAAQPEAYKQAYGQMREKSLSAFGSDVLGGALINPVLANSVIELLRAKVVTVAAGATEIQLPPSGQYSWARQTQDPTFNWIGENSAISDTEPNFGNIIFTAKKAAALVLISNDALLFTNPAVEVVVRQALAERGARFEDQAFLEGTGGSYQPLGIVNQSGLTSHTAGTVGTDGNTITPEDIANMLAKVEESNDPEGATAWIMRPLMWAAIMNRRSDSVTAGDAKGPFMFWTSRGDAAAGLPQSLNGVKVLTSTTVSNTRTKGSGTNLSYILTGNFRRAVIARAGTMEISALSSGEEFKRDQTAVRAIMRADFNLTHTKPFVLCDQLVVG